MKKIGAPILAALCLLAAIPGTGGATDAAPLKEQSPPPVAAEKCQERKIPLGLFSSVNQLLEAAQFAQWVLEDIVCKYPNEEEAKRALAKLNRAISQAEGE